MFSDRKAAWNTNRHPNIISSIRSRLQDGNSTGTVADFQAQTCEQMERDEKIISKQMHFVTMKCLVRYIRIDLNKIPVFKHIDIRLSFN